MAGRGIKRPLTAKAWDFFTPTSEERSSAKCNICSKEVKTTKGSTSGMNRHLSGYHDEFQRTKRARPSDNEWNPKEAVAKLTAVDGIVFRAVATSETLRYLFRKTFDVDLPTSPNTVREWVLKIAEEKKAVVINEIKDLKEKQSQKFTVTTDEWTSAGNHRYMNINIHGKDGQFWNLGLVRVLGSLTADECKKLLSSKLEEYEVDLAGDIFGLVTDGASVMKRFGERTGRKQQLCYAHGLHLAVVDVIYKKGYLETVDDPNQVETVEDPAEPVDEMVEEEEINADDVDDELGYAGNISDAIKKVRATVKMFRRSAQKMEKLGGYAGEGANLILDSRTRWSSLLSMLERFMSLKDGVLKTLIDFREPVTFTEDDFSMIDELVKILQPVKFAVQFLCRRDATLITADAAIQIMMSELAKVESALGERMVITMKKRVLERRTSLSDVLSYLHFKQNLEQAGHKEGYFSKPSTQQQMLSNIKQLHEIYFTSIVTVDADSSCEPDESDCDEDSPSLLESQAHEISLFDKFNIAINTAKTANLSNLPNPSNTRPSRDPGAALTAAIKKEMSDLEKFKQRGPLLSTLYNALLTIPPCSVESERVFSSANNFCRKIRTRLSDRALNALVFLKSHLNNI